MKHRIHIFANRIAGTFRMAPAESLLILFFLVYGFLMVAGALPEMCSKEEDSYLVLYPLGVTLAYILNRWLPCGTMRLAYYLSPLLVVPFFWFDIANWAGTPSFFTAIGLCPAAVLLCRWRKDNAAFADDAVNYFKNGLFAAMLALIAFLLVMAIWFSLDYIFPALKLKSVKNIINYLAVFFFIGVMPFVFLTLDRGQSNGYQPVRIIDILVNCVLTPALLIYTAILYAYFAKIAISWSLPKGSIAYMVFAFTITAVFVKAYRPLMEKRVAGWFYDRFSLISLPALAMFWTGVASRISEYGLTTGRINLLMYGAVMTFTVLMFLAPRLAAYRNTVLGGALLFSVFAFIPGITATELSIASQHKRFNAAAARLGMLDANGKLIIEKRQAATEQQQNDYSTLYDAFDYISDNTADSVMEARYGIAQLHQLTAKVMPENMCYGTLIADTVESHTAHLWAYNNRYGINISKYSMMHINPQDVRSDYDYISSYYYRIDSLSLTFYTNEGDFLLRKPLSEILEHQFAQAGINPCKASKEEIEEQSYILSLYEEDDCCIIFSSMIIETGSPARITDVEVTALLLKD